MDKNMRAGFQGQKDAMRDLADKLMNHLGSTQDVYPSSSSADKQQVRLYKKGGLVKRSSSGGVIKNSLLPACKGKRGYRNK